MYTNASNFQRIHIAKAILQSLDQAVLLSDRITDASPTDTADTLELRKAIACAHFSATRILIASAEIAGVLEIPFSETDGEKPMPSIR